MFSFSLCSWRRVERSCCFRERRGDAGTFREWLAGVMSLGLIYDFGSVRESDFSSVWVVETGIKRFCSCRVLANVEECDVTSLNALVG